MTDHGRLRLELVEHLAGAMPSAGSSFGRLTAFGAGCRETIDDGVRQSIATSACCPDIPASYWFPKVETARLPKGRSMARAGWLLLCLLSGCSASLQGSGPKACDIQKTAEIPVAADRGFIAVPAVIGTQPVTMLLDTGAERTMLTPGAVSSLNLPRDPHARTTIHGTGGTITTQNVKLPSFEIGGVGSMDPSYAVGDLPVLQGFGDPASGLIGEDWLSDYDVDLDVPERRVTLYTVQGCEGDYLPWQGARTSVTTFRYGRGIMLLKVKLDDAVLTAVLDSGANRSVVSEQAAERAGVSASDLGRDRSGRAKGVDGTTRVTHDHTFESMQIGNSRFANVRLAVGPLSAASGADMLLGLDWLRSHRVWIAYRDRKVFIKEEAR